MFRVIICLSCVSYITCEYLHLTEGSLCSWQGVQGQCVSPYKCFSTIQDIDNKEQSPGDSGGPLQSPQHELCVYTILGVTSFGRHCGVNPGPGVYTRVRHYVPWIEDIVWP